MKNIKKIWAVSLVIAIAITMLLGFASVTANDDITVTLDGAEIDFDVKPKIIDGRTVVPFRKIFEKIGALVKWDEETQTVSARKSSKTITMTIGSDNMQIDKGKTDEEGNPIIENVTLEVPSQILDGRTLVPARAISEAFGLNVDWDKNSKTVIITDDEASDDSWKENIGTINLSDLTYTGEGVEIIGNQIKITAGGDYTIKGTLNDGNITVNTEDKVKLRLSDASITSSAGSPIYFEKTDKAYITITDGTNNSLSALDGESDALYSKDNLEIKGEGTLNITSKGGHAIKASDNLTIENGVLNLVSESDGIHINDTFKITDGEINISAIGDGIDSESIVIIEGGKLNIETNGTPIETSTAQNETAATEGWHRAFEGELDVEFEKSSKGINAEWMMVISDGDITVSSASHAIHCQDEIEITGGTFSISSEYDKGISAHGNLTIDGKDTVIDITKSTEGIESKNVLTINDGKIDIVSSDDAINATGGKSGDMMGGGFGGQRPQNTDKATQENKQNQTSEFVKPDKAQRDENMQAQGQNRGNRPNMQANGEMPTPPENGQMPEPFENGNMQSPNFENNQGKPQGGFGGDMFANQKDCLIINGGEIKTIAGDDCLDANGNIVINGGAIKATKVNGSFVGVESVIDADGKTTVGENAVIIAAVGNGSSQGSLTFSQNMITLYSEEGHSVGEEIILTDKNGKSIAKYTPKGDFKAVVIISPDIKIGDDYTLTVGSKIHEITITEQKTVIGTITNQSGFGNRPR